MAFALLLLGLLGVAGLLEPNPAGHGTHRELGLPPCTIVVWTGKRCPACGMTTAWANLMQGRVVEAFQANVGGTILCGLAVAAVPWLLVSATRGRWLGWVPHGTTINVGVVLLTIVVLVDWGYRLVAE